MRDSSTQSLCRRFLPLGMAGLLLALPVRAEPPAAFLETPLPGIDKQTHRLDDWRGKLRVVNFWATWCQPCRSEIPVLRGAHREWRRQGVKIIGVALDNADDVREFARRPASPIRCCWRRNRGRT